MRDEAKTWWLYSGSDVASSYFLKRKSVSHLNHEPSFGYRCYRQWLLITSCVASPVCQEGQSERTFPIFAFSSRFFLFFPIFHGFSLFFPIFGKFFAVRGGTLPPWPPSGYTTVITLTVLLWVMQSYQTSPVRCIISLAGMNIPFIKYQKSHKSDQLNV